MSFLTLHNIINFKVNLWWRK